MSSIEKCPVCWNPIQKRTAPNCLAKLRFAALMGYVSSPDAPAPMSVISAVAEEVVDARHAEQNSLDLVP